MDMSRNTTSMVVATMLNILLLVEKGLLWAIENTAIVKQNQKMP